MPSSVLTTRRLNGNLSGKFCARRTPQGRSGPKANSSGWQQSTDVSQATGGFQ